ncbi:MAG: MerR family transcriptional regulator [Magnetospirillum sp. WYHS-4]
MNPEKDDIDEPRREGKSPEAFRTISEVAFELELPQHVLRFWETKFPLVRPLKRGGGRRYYRPEDVVLLRRIRTLLHEEGYTIKGVQKLLRQGTPGDKAKVPELIPEPPRVPAADLFAAAEQPRRGPVVYPVAPPVETPAPAVVAVDSAAPPSIPPSPDKEKRKADLSAALGELEELQSLLQTALR